MAQTVPLHRTMPRVISCDYLCALDDKAFADPAVSLEDGDSCVTELVSDAEDSPACPPPPKRLCTASRQQEATSSKAVSTPEVAKKSASSNLQCPDAPLKQRRAVHLPASRLRKLMRPLNFSSV